MQIAITDRADYNEGTLRFEWVDPADHGDADGLLEYIEAFMAKTTCKEFKAGLCAHEEWFISDYDGHNFGENPDLEEIFEYLQAVEDYSEEVVDAYLDWIDDSSSGLSARIGDSYAGTYGSPTEWAQDYIDNTGALESMPENLRYYFDYEAYARDAGMSDMYFVELGHDKTIAFHNC